MSGFVGRRVRGISRRTSLGRARGAVFTDVGADAIDDLVRG
jgi:hypothetical protein